MLFEESNEIFFFFRRTSEGFVLINPKNEFFEFELSQKEHMEEFRNLFPEVPQKKFLEESCKNFLRKSRKVFLYLSLNKNARE